LRALAIPAVAASFAALDVDQRRSPAGRAQVHRRLRRIMAVRVGAAMVRRLRCQRSCHWSRLWVIFVDAALYMRFQRLGDRVGDRFHAVDAKADRAGPADALQVLDQQLNFVAMVAVAEEQGADASQRFRHGEHVGACLAYVQEDLARNAVEVVDRN
ncbi:hypothetical protein BGX30_003307, partial [Mortierella sp. GBA39]